ncbi:2-oxoglutarate ferredoxin oxidoreductase subunit gamma [Candidatus Magnetoovum chiemensis]|nr:2-oxoglutarate ferredoxin oxidoreductase subunit gamma [Candidatus Magnetoovum chiemensis]
MEKRFLIGGSGGQGILFMGKVISYAAMQEGKNVTWFPTYGAEIRSGSVNCNVIVSDEVIGSPIFYRTDYLIVLNELSFKQYSPRLKENGILFYDSSLFLLNGKLDFKSIGVDATSLAIELGNLKVANMVMLGAVCAITGILQKHVLLTALEEDKSECTLNQLPLNQQAILKGFELIENKKSSDF